MNLEPELNEVVDLFLTHPEVRDRFDFIVSETKGEISTIQLVQEFKTHIKEQVDEGFGVDPEEIPNHFNVFLLFSGYPIKVGDDIIRMQ